MGGRWCGCGGRSRKGDGVMDDNEKVVQRILQMCSTIEGLGQELQDAQAEIKRLREALAEIMDLLDPVHAPWIWEAAARAAYETARDTLERTS